MNNNEKTDLEHAIEILQSLLQKEQIEFELPIEAEFLKWKKECNRRGEETHKLQEKYARLLVECIKRNPNHLQYNIVLPMQSGKSELVALAAKLLSLALPSYKLLYICSLSDKSYWNQVYQYYSTMGLSTLNNKIQHQIERSTMIIAKPSEIKKRELNPLINYVVMWDECHFGDGEDQGAAKHLVRELRKRTKSIVVGISATSFGIQSGETKEKGVLTIEEDSDRFNSVVLAPTLDEVRSTNYRGVTSMVENGQFYNEGLNLKLVDGLNDSIAEAILQFREDCENRDRTKIAFMRLPNTGKSNKRTQKVQKEVKKMFKDAFEGFSKVIFEDVKDNNFGYEIPNKNEVIVYFTKGGLRAGKQMKTPSGESIIPYVGMAWESSTTHVSAPTQGLAGGRFCSYLDNTHIRIYCDDRFLEFYAAYEASNYRLKDIDPQIYNTFNIRKLDSRTKPKNVMTVPRYAATVEMVDLEEYRKMNLGKHQRKISSSGNSEAHVRKMRSVLTKFLELEKNGIAQFRDGGFEDFTQRIDKSRDDWTEENLESHKKAAIIFDEVSKKTEDDYKEITEFGNWNDGRFPKCDKNGKFNYWNKVLIFTKGERVQQGKVKIDNDRGLFSNKGE